jgi:hypothetical protein
VECSCVLVLWIKPVVCKLLLDKICLGDHGDGAQLGRLASRVAAVVGVGLGWDEGCGVRGAERWGIALHCVGSWGGRAVERV